MDVKRIVHALSARAAVQLAKALRARGAATVLVAVCLVLATMFAWGHDKADSPHVSCALALDGSDTLVCLYKRHPATTPSRAGYADKGRYVLSCPVVGELEERKFITEMCRAGSGTKNSFQCWTEARHRNWRRLAQVLGERRNAREGPTQERSFEGSGLQETLLKVLANPAAVGRPHFVAQVDDGDDITANDIRAYADTCGLAINDALSGQDVVNLLPTLAVFGATHARTAAGAFRELLADPQQE